MTRKRVAVLAVTTLVLAAVMTTATWALSRTHGPRPGTMMSGRANSATVRGTGFMSGTGMMGGSGMMGGYGVAGNGRRVGSLDGARARAQVFAERLGLRVGEIMQFTNGFYAEIVTADDQGATEVLVNSANGAVSVEPGPAMMWNTRYGMQVTGGSTDSVSPEQARSIAQQWLERSKPGLSAGQPEVFPGYVTIDTARSGKTVGMMSVNTSTGTVWYHTWHGSFVAASEG